MDPANTVVGPLIFLEYSVAVKEEDVKKKMTQFGEVMIVKQIQHYKEGKYYMQCLYNKVNAQQFPEQIIVNGVTMIVVPSYFEFWDRICKINSLLEDMNIDAEAILDGLTVAVVENQKDINDIIHKISSSIAESKPIWKVLEKILISGGINVAEIKQKILAALHADNFDSLLSIHMLTAVASMINASMHIHQSLYLLIKTFPDHKKTISLQMKITKANIISLQRKNKQLIDALESNNFPAFQILLSDALLQTSQLIEHIKSVIGKLSELRKLQEKHKSQLKRNVAADVLIAASTVVMTGFNLSQLDKLQDITIQHVVDLVSAAAHGISAITNVIAYSQVSSLITLTEKGLKIASEAEGELKTYLRTVQNKHAHTENQIRETVIYLIEDFKAEDVRFGKLISSIETFCNANK